MPDDEHEAAAWRAAATDPYGHEFRGRWHRSATDALAQATKWAITRRLDPWIEYLAGEPTQIDRGDLAAILERRRELEP